MKTKKAKTNGISLAESLWERIDRATGGRHGSRSQFLADAAEEKLSKREEEAVFKRHEQNIKNVLNCLSADEISGVVLTEKEKNQRIADIKSNFEAMKKIDPIRADYFSMCCSDSFRVIPVMPKAEKKGKKGA